MRKNAFNAKEHIAALNQFKESMNGAAFDSEQLLAIFKANKIPTNQVFWNEFLKSGLVIVVGDKLAFASRNPIYYGALERIYNKYNAKMRAYHKKASKPKEEKPVTKVEETHALESFAIDFLKELGYKIMAPVGTVYQEI